MKKLSFLLALVACFAGKNAVAIADNIEEIYEIFEILHKYDDYKREEALAAQSHCTKDSTSGSNAQNVKQDASVQTVKVLFPAQNDAQTSQVNDLSTAIPNVKNENKTETVKTFSPLAGVKKTVAFLVKPFTAYPIVTAISAGAGLVYAHKKGYLLKIKESVLAFWNKKKK